MKKLPLLVWALLAGQLVTLRKKDKSFSTTLNTKKWFDAIRYVFDSLLNFNTELFNEGKETVQSIDAREEYARLEWRALELKENFSEFTTEKKTELTTELTKQFDTLKLKAHLLDKDLDEKFNYKDKLKKLQTLLQDLSSQLNK